MLPKPYASKAFQYGVCYYPEHWDESRHASDIKRIAKCGFNFVRLGEGAWNYWEPEEGKFQFKLFDKVIDLCRKQDIKVVMGTPTYAAPAWVAAKYPEVLRWNFDRQPMGHGSRRNLNYTSPKYLQLSDRLCTALAQHYKGESQIFAWQLDNEFNCHMDTSYAPTDTAAFRVWLKTKYKTLDKLNDAWGTKFWAQTYSDWSQIDLPQPTATYMNPTQLLDETRFISDCVVSFAASQAEILRKANKKWVITHNNPFGNIDLVKFNGVLDLYCHDIYPQFFSHWSQVTGNLQQSRSMSFPYGILEQQSGPGGQMSYLHATPRPGQMRLWAWQSIMNGAKLLSYFRWRTCPYGSEQHWHGLLDPDDRDNSRVAEAVLVGKEIAALPKDFFDAPVQKCAAVLRDFDNESNDRRVNTYNKEGSWEAMRLSSGLLKRQVPVDTVWPESDFSGYDVIFAGHLKIVDKAMVDKLTAYVKAGGVLVLGAQSGLKDRNAHLVELPQPGLLKTLAGLEVSAWTTLPEKESREAKLPNGRSLALNTFVEALAPTKSAEAIAYWSSDDSLLKGLPAMTVNKVGDGKVFYIGGYVLEDALPALMDHLIPELGLKASAQGSPDIEAIPRKSGKKRYLALLNHGKTMQVVKGLPAGRELFGKTDVHSQLELPAYGVALLELA